jgi:hypothetical protein
MFNSTVSLSSNPHTFAVSVKLQVFAHCQILFLDLSWHCLLYLQARWPNLFLLFVVPGSGIHFIQVQAETV